ncbi:MAG: PTS sugar transporter subunit IIA [Candidatus Hydrogenedentes bacterium]|nr:PTS sugar transporter subunit IIA [Candidatus Hydrogenedentota bacterium]
MQMSVSDAARLFRVSEDTIYRWVQEDELPAARFNDRYHFSRVRLVEWAHKRRVPFTLEGDSRQSSLEESVLRGGVRHGVSGNDKRSVFEQVVALLPLPESTDRGYLLEMLLARERQGTTGFGKGIAIPHARDPILLRVTQPVVMLAYLNHPIDFEAIDLQPVFALFTMVTPTISAHLHLLSKLGSILEDPEMLRLLEARAGTEVVVTRIRHIEQDAVSSSRTQGTG